MTRNLEIPELDLAVSTIQNLSAAKAEAEVHIADCLRHLGSEQKMLDSLLAEPKNPTNKPYLDLSKKAYRQGVKAWKLSITAFQNDVDTYKSEINAILKRVPAARLDN